EARHEVQMLGVAPISRFPPARHVGKRRQPDTNDPAPGLLLGGGQWTVKRRMPWSARPDLYGGVRSLPLSNWGAPKKSDPFLHQQASRRHKKLPPLRSMPAQFDSARQN